MEKRIYRNDGFVLCACTQCGRLNYAEPHGDTALCKCRDEFTRHVNIPYQYRDQSGCVYRGSPRLINLEESK